MFNFRERRIFERILYSKAALGALFIMLLFSLNAVWGVYEKYYEARKNRDAELVEKTVIKERVHTLENEVSLLKTDRGIEKKIREEFGFAEEGEGVIVIVEETARMNNPIEQKRNFLGSIWEGALGMF